MLCSEALAFINIPRLALFSLVTTSWQGFCVALDVALGLSSFYYCDHHFFLFKYMILPSICFGICAGFELMTANFLLIKVKANNAKAVFVACNHFHIWIVCLFVLASLSQVDLLRLPGPSFLS